MFEHSFDTLIATSGSPFLAAEVMRLQMLHYSESGKRKAKVLRLFIFILLCFDI